jgi:hypothetical protein
MDETLRSVCINQNLNYMKCTHNTLTSLLSAWDRLEVIGTNPDKQNSILTSNDFVKIAIEYRIEEGGARCAPYIHAFLVMYDQNGHRRSVIKNGSWGCHGEDMMEFKLWFAKKLRDANDLQEQRIEDEQDRITDFLS